MKAIKNTKDKNELNFECKIASLDEMNVKWDYQIKINAVDKENWKIWKNENINRYKLGFNSLFIL